MLSDEGLERLVGADLLGDVGRERDVGELPVVGGQLRRRADQGRMAGRHDAGSASRSSEAR
jgi:hypothetical protein